MRRLHVRQKLWKIDLFLTPERQKIKILKSKHLEMYFLTISCSAD